MKTSGLFSTDNSYNHNSAYGKETLRIKYLEHKIDKLYMITEALWLLLKEKSNLDDENLTELIAAIDMKDGHRDGIGIWYLVFGIWYLVFGIWYLVFGIWYLVFGIWYLVLGTWCFDL